MEPPGRRGRAASRRVEWPARVDREWALGGSTGDGRPRLHPRQRRRGRPPARRRGRQGAVAIVADGERRAGRRGRRRATSAATAPPAPASSARSRPTCELHSVRVLGAGYTGQRPDPPRRAPLGGRAGLRRHQHEPLDDEAAVRRRPARARRHAPTSSARVLVASAHNMPVESFPWRFSSVISVGSHEARRPARALREPGAAGRVLRARRRRRRRLARRRARSAPPATASRRRTCAGSARSCSPSTRS